MRRALETLKLRNGQMEEGFLVAVRDSVANALARNDRFNGEDGESAGGKGRHAGGTAKAVP